MRGAIVRAPATHTQHNHTIMASAFVSIFGTERYFAGGIPEQQYLMERATAKPQKQEEMNKELSEMLKMDHWREKLAVIKERKAMEGSKILEDEKNAEPNDLSNIALSAAAAPEPAAAAESAAAAEAAAATEPAAVVEPVAGQQPGAAAEPAAKRARK